MDKGSKTPFVFATLATIGVKTDKMDFTHNSLIAVTAAGIIIGTYVSDEVKKTLENDLTYITFENMRTLADESGDNISAAILLKDVTLITHQGSKNSFNFLYLFIEDIIALSYGNMVDN